MIGTLGETESKDLVLLTRFNDDNDGNDDYIFLRYTMSSCEKRPNLEINENIELQKL